MLTGDGTSQPFATTLRDPSLHDELVQVLDEASVSLAVAVQMNNQLRTPSEPRALDSQERQDANADILPHVIHVPTFASVLQCRSDVPRVVAV